MKYFMCLAVIVAVIGVACAHPAAAAAAAAGSAAVSGATAENGDAAKKVYPTDTIAALSKNAKDLNPLVVTAQITKFMDTLKEACEKFFQGILGGSGASPLGALPAGTPDMSKLLNPLDVGKSILKMKSNIIGSILKDFGGASDQKDAAAATSSAASAAASNGKSEAAAASGAAAETGDATKIDPKDAIAAISKNIKNSNPLVEAEITKFMATIEEACEKFVQGIFGGSGASPLGALPAGTPGMSSGPDASPSDQKVTSAAAAAGASAAIAQKKGEAAVAPVKATTGRPDIVASMENAGAEALSNLFGDFGF